MQNRFAEWTFTFSIPKNMPNETPKQRDRIRYARLTSLFIFVLFALTAIPAPLSIFYAYNPWAPFITILSLLCVIIAYPVNKIGGNIPAASLLVSSTIITSVGTMLTNSLDPVFISIFCALVISVILAGSLMPPMAAIVTAVINSIVIILINLYQTHTTAFEIAIHQKNIYAMSLVLPLALQIGVAIIIYTIMGNLIGALNRAEEAEQIVQLQKQITLYERARAEEKQQLEDGIALIARVHAQIANGNLDVRVPLGAEDILWQVAVPLNNLLNRVQNWKDNADRYEMTQRAINNTLKEIQQAKAYHRQVPLQRTGTPIDPLLVEMNNP